MTATAPPPISAIQAAVCVRFGLGDRQLVSEMQSRPFSGPRHIAMWLCRRAGYSLPRIGRAFDRDHTTVMLAVEQVAGWIEDRRPLGRAAIELAAEVGGMGTPLDPPE